jgi:hypothetical protein
MNDHFQSLDETVRAIREACDTQVKAAQDRCVAAEIEATICKDQLTKANAERDRYLRIAERLVTKFAVVEAVFAEARSFATQVPEIGAQVTREVAATVPPINQMQSTDEQAEEADA